MRNAIPAAGPNATRSKRLAAEKVLDAINKLPALLRGRAKKYLQSKIPLRHGSAAFAKRHPEAVGVSMQEKIHMARMQEEGISYRALEEIFHLIPNSGMDAYRCVQEAREHQKGQKQKAS